MEEPKIGLSGKGLKFIVTPVDCWPKKFVISVNVTFDF